jgi:glycosyltransferase involved in cell wall biosynthesis
MNILMIHPHDIFSPAEPWTVRIVYLAKEFRKKGHLVKLVYFPVEYYSRQPVQLAEGITAIPLCRRHGPGVFLKNIFLVWSLSAGAQVIHLQKCFYHAAVPAMLAALTRNKPLHYDWDDWEVKIYEVSTQPSFLRNFIRGFLDILENNLPKIADTVSVASARLREECLKLSGHRDTIFDAPVGADLERFKPDIDGNAVRKKYGITQPLILYLGQLHGGQYVEQFIRAAAKLLQEYPRAFNFMIVGDGYLAKELKKLAGELKLDDLLIFTGAVGHELVPQYIAAADICVACFQENEVTLCKSPLKIAEYMASGKAIVASNVGEVEQMLGGSGLLVEPGDPVALSEGIMTLLKDTELRNKLGKAARKRAQEKYNWTATAANILQAYERIKK